MAIDVNTRTALGVENVKYRMYTCSARPTNLHLVLQDWDLLVRGWSKLLPSSRVPGAEPHTTGMQAANYSSAGTSSRHPQERGKRHSMQHSTKASPDCYGNSAGDGFSPHGSDSNPPHGQATQSCTKALTRVLALDAREVSYYILSKALLLCYSTWQDGYYSMWTNPCQP